MAASLLVRALVSGAPLHDSTPVLTVRFDRGYPEYFGTRAAIEAEDIPGIWWPEVGKVARWTSKGLAFEMHRVLPNGHGAVTRRDVDYWWLSFEPIGGAGG